MSSFYSRHKRFFNRTSGLLLNNTVLERGLVIAPVVVAANTLKNAFVLGAAFCFITFFTVLAASFVPRVIPYTVRIFSYVLISAAWFVPCAVFLNYIMPETVYKVGIFLPLLITNSLVVSRTDSRFIWEKRKVMIFDVFFHVMGFFAVIIIVGLIREFFAAGTIWDNPVSELITVPALMYPFSGFIIAGFLSAVLQKIRISVRKSDRNEVSGDE